MEDPNIELADAVCADLNANVLASLTPPVTAERDYLPVLSLEALGEAVHVFVVAKTEEATPVTREAQQADREIQIAVVRKLKRGSNNGFDRATIDGLLRDVVKPIKDRLRFRPQGSAGDGYKWFRTVHDPLYDPEHLDTYGQFTSLVTVSYRRVEK